MSGPKEQWNEILRIKREKGERFLSPHDGAIPIRLDDEALFYVDPGVVCRGSRYFASLFLGNWAEREKVKSGEAITISEIPCDSMAILLHYLYVGEVRKDALPKLSRTRECSEAFFEQYWGLIHWAHLLTLPDDFEEELSDYCARHLRLANLCQAWQQAEDWRCAGLMRQCVRFLVQNFADFSSAVSNSQANAIDLESDSPICYFYSCPRSLLGAALNSGKIAADYEELVALVLEWGRRNLAREKCEKPNLDGSIDANSSSVGNALDENEMIMEGNVPSWSDLQRYCADLLPPFTLFNREHKAFILEQL
jgi:hypothetical protein